MVGDSLILCNFISREKPKLCNQIFNAVTGFDISLNEMIKAGERIFNIKRVFNVLAGVTRKDDTLPRRL